MGWCENTDTPHAVASAGACWHGAAGARLFIPAEGLPVEPSCFFGFVFFFYVHHPILHQKIEMQDLFPFPGTTLPAEALEKGRGCHRGSSRSRPCCCRCCVRCFTDRRCRGSKDGDFVAEPVARRPRSSVLWGWGCYEVRKPPSGSCGAPRPVPQRVDVLARFESAVVDWKLLLPPALSMRVPPLSRPAGAAQRGSISAGGCRRALGGAFVQMGLGPGACSGQPSKNKLTCARVACVC